MLKKRVHPALELDIHSVLCWKAAALPAEPLAVVVIAVAGVSTWH